MKTVLGLAIALFANCFASASAGEPLLVGFAHTDITPAVGSGGEGDRPVWLAGYGQGRRATGVHDPLYARAVVLRNGKQSIAMVSVDLVGLQYPEVQAIRKRLPEIDYVVISSTHNHEGPDVIGIWGRSFVHRGVDPEYIQLVEDRTVEAIRAADNATVPVTARFGTAKDETLLGDSRKPIVFDGVLRAIKFTRVKDGAGGRADGSAGDSGSVAGVLVQWNCHPESLGSKNTLVTADFCFATVAALEKKYNCPVAYFTGAVGGLMAPPDTIVKDASGKELLEGDFEYARVYGEMTADLASKAIDSATPIELTPFVVSAKPIALLVENLYYRTARSLGVLQRPGVEWTGDFETLGKPLSDPAPPAETPDISSGLLPGDASGSPMAIETEVAYLRLGELHIACIPGEIYPELVYGKFQDPVEPAVDFPDAPLEPFVAELMPGDRWMLLGLANDEVGYIIPKRQWDDVAPFAYGRERSQYGEINSCGKEVAPILMEAIQRRVREASEK
jgi:hypothetical protein